MCEKNLDESIKVVGSDYRGYEYPCLTLDHHHFESGCFYRVTIRLSCFQFASVYHGTCLESARERPSYAAKGLGVPLL
jgi:hypothetical protein